MSTGQQFEFFADKFEKSVDEGSILKKPNYCVDVDILTPTFKTETCVSSETLSDLVSKYLNQVYKKFGGKQTLKYKVREIYDDLKCSFPFESESQRHHLLLKIVNRMKSDTCLFYVDKHPEIMEHLFVSITDKELKTRQARQAASKRTALSSPRSRIWQQNDKDSEDDEDDSESHSNSSSSDECSSVSDAETKFVMSSPLRTSPLPGIGKILSPLGSESVVTVSDLFSNLLLTPLNPLHFTQMRTPIGKKKCKKKPKKKGAASGAIDEEQREVEDEAAITAGETQEPPLISETTDDITSLIPPAESTPVVLVSELETAVSAKETDVNLEAHAFDTVSAPEEVKDTVAALVVDLSWSVVERDKRVHLTNKLEKLREKVRARENATRTTSDIKSGGLFRSQSAALIPTPVQSLHKSEVPSTVHVSNTKMQWVKLNASAPLLKAGVVTPPPLLPALITHPRSQIVEATAREVAFQSTPEPVIKVSRSVLKANAPPFFPAASVISLHTKMHCTITQSSGQSAPVVMPHCHFVPDYHRGRYISECDYDTAVRAMMEPFNAQRRAMSRGSVQQCMHTRPSETQLRLEVYGLDRDFLVGEVWGRLQGGEGWHMVNARLESEKHTPAAPAAVTDEVKVSRELTSQLPLLVKVESSGAEIERKDNHIHPDAPPLRPTPPLTDPMSFYDTFSTSAIASLPASTPWYREAIGLLADQFARSAAKVIAASGHPYRVSNVQATADRPEFYKRLPPLLQQVDKQKIVKDVVDAMKSDRRLCWNGSWFYLNSSSDASMV